MAKRWARSKSEANQMFLRQERGTCQKCGVEFHRLTKGVGVVPTHRPGTARVEWVDRKWSNGVVTYEMRRNGFITTGMCSGSRKQPAEKLPPPPDPATVVVKTRLRATTKHGRPRDSQRQKVYDAENAAAWNDRAMRRLTGPEAQKLADRMYDWLLAEGYELRRPQVTMTRGGGSVAWWGTGVIHFGRQRPFAWILAHEVAHLVRPKGSAFPGREWDADGRVHGWEWASVYLALVRRFLGVTNHDALAASFKAGKVKSRPKRRMTEAQRQAAADRLAKYRAAKSHPQPELEVQT